MNKNGVKKLYKNYLNQIKMKQKEIKKKDKKKLIKIDKHKK